MADTAGRLLHLLGLLQRQPSWGGPELAGRLGVDVRTIRRDVDRLRSLGYQVDSAPGVAGGYRLGVGSELPPLLLDDEEAMAVAVVLGVSAGAAIPGVDSAALATLARIDRLLPPRIRNQVAALRSTTVALPSPAEPVPVENLVRLAQACDSHELAAFGYRARDGAESDRRVEPYRLVSTQRRWYLVAFDLDRRDWRTFRADRVSSVLLTGHTFEPRPLDDPARLVSEAISTAPYQFQATVRVHAPLEEVAKRVRPDVGVLEASGRRTLLRLGAESLEWLASSLVEIGLEFEVLRPIELRDHLRSLGERLAAAHRPRPG